MDDVEKQILSYPHLSPDRKRAVEAYVEANPEWASLLRDVRAFEAMHGRESESLPASVLRVYVVVEHVEDRTDCSSALEQTLDRIERRIEADPALQSRVDAIRRRVEAAEDAIDPVAHLERLTDIDIADEASDGGTESAASAGFSFGRRLMQMPVWGRRAGIVLLGVFGAYLALALVSRMSQSSLDRLSTITVDEQMLNNYRRPAGGSRAASDTLSAGALYMQTLSTLRRARTSTLGLFPRYNPDSLRQGKRDLKQVLRRAESGSFVAQEARFYLGKVHLAQRNLSAARSSFERVVQEGGRHAEAARRLLKALDRVRTDTGR